jgi:hypothetical protein
MPARHGHASIQTSPRDDTTRNVHRKKDIPQRARPIPPEKHSTSPAQTPASRRANRIYGNAAPFPLATVSENL